MTLKFADLHIHSNYSDAWPTIKEILKYVETKTDLDIIAITDHDTIDGALVAKEIAKKDKLRIKIIVGEEISCQEGHIVGLFMKRAIPPSLPLSEVIKLIKKQNGIIIAPHPFVETPLKDFNNNKTGGIGLSSIIKQKNNIDALEVVNGNLVMTYKENLKARFINQNYLFKATIGGSDAHILSGIGKGYTIFKGNTIADLRKSIINKETLAFEKKWNLTSSIKYIIFIIPELIKSITHLLIIKLNDISKNIEKVINNLNWNNRSVFNMGFIFSQINSKIRSRNRG